MKFYRSVYKHKCKTTILKQKEVNVLQIYILQTDNILYFFIYKNLQLIRL